MTDDTSTDKEVQERTLLELRIHMQQLRTLVTEMQGSVESHDRSLKWVAIGGIAILMIIATCWLR